MAAASPFFKSLPLQDYGLEYIHPARPVAHPFDNGRAASLFRSLAETAQDLGRDDKAYQDLIGPLTRAWPTIENDVFAPLMFPSNPLALARFGWSALQPATTLARHFKTPEARALWAGMAAHSLQPLTNLTTSAIGLVLMILAHLRGWPIPKGGSQKIADALASYFLSLGGKIETGVEVTALSQLPSARAVLLDVTPRQVLQIAGHKLSTVYTWQLQRYRYGMGVFKVDWALDGSIPFTAEACRQAGTVHIGNSFEEIQASEAAAGNGKHTDRPFVLLAQQSLFDPSRAPEGKHTAWAYCHVPHGSTVDRTEVMEKQIERFAPGFRERILSRHTFNTAQLENYNFNYIGGDINGGVIDIGQLFTRPALRRSPYRTSLKGLYICSSSTPPGGGVHGMCGYHAARRALKDVFQMP